MKIYTLITEKHITGSSSSVESFVTKEAAAAVMQEAWKKAAAEYRATGVEPLKEECFIEIRARKPRPLGRG